MTETEQPTSTQEGSSFWSWIFPSRVKKFQHRDYHETFVFGQTAIHRILLRSLERIVEASKPGGELATADPNKVKDFLQYVDLFRAFLDIHHYQEDLYIFPEAMKRSGKEDLFAQETDEHKALEGGLATLKELCAPAVEGKEVSGDAVVKVQEVCAGVLGVMQGDKGHLQREEAVLDADFYRKHYTEAETKKLSNDIHSIIAKHMHRGLSLVFMIFHLTDEEKTFFDERLPWFLKTFLFPRWAGRKSAGVWKYANHPRFNKNQQPVYSEPQTA